LHGLAGQQGGADGAKFSSHAHPPTQPICLDGIELELMAPAKCPGGPMNLLNAASASVVLSIVISCSGATNGTSAPAPPAQASAPAASTRAAENQSAPANPTGAAVNPTGAAVKLFLDRTNEYVKFHNNVEKMVPPLAETSDPVKISTREKALGEALIKSRPDAKPGDFFIKEVQPIIAKIIKDDFAKRSLADRKALVQELPKGLKVGVNEIYPSTLPLATFPGNLLKALPELPPELEYRTVGRDLILRDIKGNVIVDIMRDVVPIPV
jgi:hypothetical protein